MRKIKNLVWDFLRVIKLGGIVQLALKSPMLEDGWFKSFNEKKSIDSKGHPIPWCTYPFLKFIEPRLEAGMEVFEFGSGNSTLWYAQNVKTVYSVEHNQNWVDILQKKLPTNAKVVFKPLDNGIYAKQVLEDNRKFNLIIVDGEDRNNCLIHSADSVNDNGVIILDNSERIEYLPGIDFLLSKGYKKIDFWGLSPIISTYNCTTVFYKENNCLNI